MAGTMKAIVLYEKGRCEIRDVMIPQAGDDDILIRMTTTAICGSELHLYFGNKDPKFGYPAIMGHECSGIIAAKGKNVSDYWNVGDRVVTDNTTNACGHCISCLNGHFVQCEKRSNNGNTMDGVHAEYILVTGKILKVFPNCIMHLPDTIPFDDAPQLEPAANGYRAVIQECSFQSGENIVVFGSGALGLFSLHHAAISGASKAIMIGQESDRDIRFPIARKMGATHTLTTNGKPIEEVVKEVKDIVGPHGADVVIDTVGIPIIMKMCLCIVRNEGRISRIGSCGTAAPYGYPVNDFSKICTIIGHMGYDSISWMRCINLAVAGKLDLRSIITHRIRLEEYPLGMELMRTQQAGKILIKHTNDK